MVIAVGSRVERPLEVPGSDLDGVHFAMDYLYQRNRAVARADGREAPEPEYEITAAGKRVVVIGGGDTGMDCLSSANREGAASVTMLDVYGDVPAGGRYPDTPWPEAPRRTETTYALDEGGERRFSTQVTEIEGDGTRGARARPPGHGHLVARPGGGRGLGVRGGRRPVPGGDRLLAPRARRPDLRPRPGPRRAAAT